MLWNSEQGYVTYKVALQNIKSLLGISEIDYILRPELSPYVTYILDYISTNLSRLDNPGKKELLSEVFEIQDHGANLIIMGAVVDLAFEVGISTKDVYIEDKEIPYNQERFILAWTNILTALVVRIKFQYYNLLQQDPESGCPCPYPKGDDTKTYDAWNSGVYPEDEGLDYNFSVTGTSSWRTASDIPECSKCSKK